MVTCTIRACYWWDESAGGGGQGEFASWSCLGESGKVYGSEFAEDQAAAANALVPLAKEAAIARCGHIDEFRVIYIDSSHKDLPVVVESGAPRPWLPTMSCLRGEP